MVTQFEAKLLLLWGTCPSKGSHYIKFKKSTMKLQDEHSIQPNSFSFNPFPRLQATLLTKYFTQPALLVLIRLIRTCSHSSLTPSLFCSLNLISYNNPYYKWTKLSLYSKSCIEVFGPSMHQGQ